MKGIKINQFFKVQKAQILNIRLGKQFVSIFDATMSH